MKIVDRGNGVPMIVVPGIQGRWEWMSPAIEALATRCRVITFSLADEPSCGGGFDAANGFDCYVAQVDAALDLAGLERAAICGVSYGGLIAAAFAARHPERTAALVLVSALPPTWRPDDRVRFYLRAPRLLSPLFMLASLRMYREIAAAASGGLGGMRAALGHGGNVLRHLFSPTRMAARVARLGDQRLIADLRALKVPTLVVTGEAELDRVVPVQRTREYLAMWPHAVEATIARTGHLGLITRPEAFADVVVPFIERHGTGSSGHRGMAPGPDTQIVRRRIV
jgi:pimeloyl-ACP methyl ester carboxylesterase